MSQGSATTTTRLRAQLAQQVTPENTRSIFPGAGWVYIAPPNPYEVLVPDQFAPQLEEEKGASNLLVVVALLIALIAISVAAYWIKLPPESMGTNVATLDVMNRRVVATELNMRERPSMRSPVQFILPMGTRIDVLNETQQEIDGDVWIKIRVQTAEGPQVGWVDARYIR
jgi:hypothetical protein